MAPFEMENGETIAIDKAWHSTIVWLKKENSPSRTYKLLEYSPDQWSQLSAYDFSDQLDNALSRRQPCTK